MAGVSVLNVHKVYPGGITALNDCSLEVKDKEFLVLTGSSGCGKTTLLRMISGLEAITKGEIYIGEDLINDLPPGYPDVAMVFQNYSLYPHMTIYQNIAFALEMERVPKREIVQRVKATAKLLDIEFLLSRKPKELSGGQLQRVAIGRAIIRRPAVILFDEPLSNLDAAMRVSMRKELKELHTRIETTFIYVTHDKAEAETLGQRIAIMEDGAITRII